jgi:hypothetical protein
MEDRRLGQTWAKRWGQKDNTEKSSSHLLASILLPLVGKTVGRAASARQPYSDKDSDKVSVKVVDCALNA